MLIGGPATLPWTFLGSFLLNLWTAYSGGHGSDEPWWIAAVVIGSASMLQAAIGGTTLRMQLSIRLLSTIVATFAASFSSLRYFV